MIRIALATAFASAVALGVPASGEASGARVKARSTVATQNVAPQRAARPRAKLRARSMVAEKPCAARTWAGCQGWDPDPNVRSMIQMDAGRDDY
ncbi:MAG: hypothetical protein IT536_05110 [Hyphomicrobiales bacterium]|nr:hypothetical protein [Hyphomicrobiales bacterium]